jgi:hypothetical protein
VGICGAEEELHFKAEDTCQYTNQYINDNNRAVSGAHAISIYAPSGKHFNIDFSGDKVTYSGDLPVDEGAKIFFDAVFKIYSEHCKCPKCGTKLTSE